MMERPLLRFLLAAIVCGRLAVAGAPAAVPVGDNQDLGDHLARVIEEVLWRNGSLARSESSYRANPVGGGDVLSFQWMLADFLRMQRQEYHKILDSTGHVMALEAGFPRQKAILDSVDRMIAFKKANRRFLSIKGLTPVTPETAIQLDRLKSALEQMQSRISDLERLLTAAL